MRASRIVHLVIEWCTCSYTIFFISPTAIVQGRTSKYKYPLFGLSELGNVTARMPEHPALEEAVGDEPQVVYAQFYSPTVKAMEERVPLIARPNLLTYLLGEGYVSGSAKFKGVWDEVRTQRTLYELVEVVHPAVPLDARMELVVTDYDSSFLASFGAPSPRPSDAERWAPD